jgi:hypothetical protein
MFKCIHPDNVPIPSGCHSEFDKLLEVIHEESCAKIKSIEPVPVQPSRQASEGIRTPRSVLQINIDDVQTLEPHGPDARSISILQEVYSKKSTLNGKFQYSVRTTWHHVRTMFIICKPSGRLGNTSRRYKVIHITPEFRSNAERISVKTVRMLDQAVQTHT